VRGSGAKGTTPRVLRASSTFTSSSLLVHGNELHSLERFVASSSSSSSSSLGSSSSRRWFSSAVDNDDDDSNDHRLPFLLADIGEGIKEVELLQWYCQPGDTIQQFDKVCEVQSDKATVEITSRYDGVVAALAGNVGDMMQVGQPLLFMQSSTDAGSGSGSVGGGSGTSSSSDGTTASDAASASVLHDTETEPLDDRLSIPTIASQFHLESDNTAGATATDNPPTADDKFLTSPAVRKLGREYGLELSTIHGSGPQGRLLKSDVLTYLREQGYTSDSNNETSASTSTPSAASTATPLTQPKDGQKDDEIHTLRGYSRLMVGAMTAALEIPHMCFGDELEVGRLLQCRKELKESTHGHNISILAFLIKACSLALKQYPLCNAILHDLDKCQLKIMHSHNLGIAMDTPRGLVVPVIRDVQTKSLVEIQHDLDRLKALAADSKLSPDDLTTPTFSLSNIGSVGVGTYMQPVIVPPQLAMGAFGKIQRVPRFVVDKKGDNNNNSNNDDQIYAASIMNVSWAGDHRFLDGATLARFHAAFKGYVENPVHMLVHLK
jgi:2-oxoisovalerate dehydrogenase E2 component (dihydrolipoyl transacylase)